MYACRRPVLQHTIHPHKQQNARTTDLFKWACKLGPYAPASLIDEALRLAIQCRVLDMRASPYDLGALDPSIDFGALFLFWYGVWVLGCWSLLSG